MTSLYYLHVVVSLAKLCPTLCDPMDHSPSGSSVCEVSQARIQEWVAISFSRGSFWSRDRTHFSYICRWVLYYLHIIALHFTECHIIGIMQYVVFFSWFISLSNVHLSFFYVFSGLIAYFFWAVNNIPLPGSTRVCLSNSILKGILIGSNSGQLWLNLL